MNVVCRLGHVHRDARLRLACDHDTKSARDERGYLIEYERIDTPQPAAGAVGELFDTEGK